MNPFQIGDKVLLPSGIENDTGVIVSIDVEAGIAAVKLDVNGNVSPFNLADLRAVPAAPPAASDPAPSAPPAASDPAPSAPPAAPPVKQRELAE